jgi:hypothetical protein
MGIAKTRKQSKITKPNDKDGIVPTILPRRLSPRSTKGSKRPNGGNGALMMLGTAADNQQQNHHHQKQSTVPTTAGLKPCVECNGGDVSGVHRCDLCDGFMHGFCGEGIGEEGYGQCRRCSQCVTSSLATKTDISPSFPTQQVTKSKGARNKPSTLKGGRRRSCTTEQNLKFMQTYMQIEANEKERLSNDTVCGFRDAKFISAKFVDGKVAEALKKTDLFTEHDMSQSKVTSMLSNIKSRFSKDKNGTGMSKG